MRSLVVLSIVLSVSACQKVQPVSPTPPIIEDTDQCAQACQRLSQLGCDEGRPVPAGVECVSDSDCRVGDQCMDRVCHASCETFCRETQAWGAWLQPRCVSQINFCGELNNC